MAQNSIYILEGDVERIRSKSEDDILLISHVVRGQIIADLKEYTLKVMIHIRVDDAFVHWSWLDTRTWKPALTTTEVLEVTESDFSELQEEPEWWRQFLKDWSVSLNWFFESYRNDELDDTSFD